MYIAEQKMGCKSCAFFRPIDEETAALIGKKEEFSCWGRCVEPTISKMAVERDPQKLSMGERSRLMIKRFPGFSTALVYIRDDYFCPF